MVDKVCEKCGNAVDWKIDNLGNPSICKKCFEELSSFYGYKDKPIIQTYGMTIKRFRLNKSKSLNDTIFDDSNFAKQAKSHKNNICISCGLKVPDDYNMILNGKEVHSRICPKCFEASLIKYDIKLTDNKAYEKILKIFNKLRKEFEQSDAYKNLMESIRREEGKLQRMKEKLQKLSDDIKPFVIKANKDDSSSLGYSLSIRDKNGKLYTLIASGNKDVLLGIAKKVNRCFGRKQHK